MSREALLSVRNLTVRLPGTMDRAYAVRDLSFDLYRGEILCIVGESGSGKSVTANTIMGLLPPSLTVESGSILLGEQDIVTMDEAGLRSLRGRTVAMIFQDPLSALNPLMRIGEQIEEAMAVHGVGTPASRRATCLALLAEVGLPEPELIRRQYPFRLSGGQRQRVMIAMALALEPDILIADEATTALDVTTQAQILALIRDLQTRRTMSVMFITHDFDVVKDLADRVLVMENGDPVEIGTAAAVLSAPASAYTRRLLAAVPKLADNDRAGAAEGEPLLSIRNLQKSYRAKADGFWGRHRSVTALADVSLDLHRGRTIGVVGESGSGKSTLGRALLKFLDCDAGSIIYRGVDIAPMPEKRFRPLRRHIQMIFQDPLASLNPRQTIGTALIAAATVNGIDQAEAQARAAELMTLVGLGAGALDRYPHEFSGGQRQRIGIARALILDPDIIVADEAVSALDVSIQAQILDLLGQVQARLGLAMLFITHDLRVASQICDEIIVMHRGRIVEAGAPSRIFRAPQHAYTRQLVAAIPGHEIPVDQASCG